MCFVESVYVYLFIYFYSVGVTLPPIFFQILLLVVRMHNLYGTYLLISRFIESEVKYV